MLLKRIIFRIAFIKMNFIYNLIFILDKMNITDDFKDTLDSFLELSKEIDVIELWNIIKIESFFKVLLIIT